MFIILFSWKFYFEGQYQAMATNIWADKEPLEGNDCSVISGLKLKSNQCDSEEHFVCVGKDVHLFITKIMPKL